MTAPHRKKLIEVAIPLTALNEEAAKEKSVPRRGHPQTIHLWWARRPLAAARGVLFAQLVDDPSSLPEEFPTEESQNQERQRLFRLMEQLVQWENSNNEAIIESARFEIARSHARTSDSSEARRILSGMATPRQVNSYLAKHVAAIHDPFSGGATISLEAQRLGLRAIGTDLNPVAVLIGKSLIEIAPRFVDAEPVNPRDRESAALENWTAARGLAQDVDYYGSWVLSEAQKRLRSLYPDVSLPKHYGGGTVSVIAWIWARTVASPNPAFTGCEVPLVSSFWLNAKPGKETWIEPVVNGKKYRFEIRSGKPQDKDRIGQGTKSGRGANFRCILSGAPIEPDYVKAEGEAKRLGARLMAVVVQVAGRRLYLPPPSEGGAVSIQPSWLPTQELPANRQYCNPPLYGMTTFGDLFTNRQLAALCVFSDLITEVRERVLVDARRSKLSVRADGHLRDGGAGPLAYSEAVTTYLALALGRLVDYNSTICTWNAIGGSIRSTFARQAFPITWDFYETNPLADTTGSWSSACSWVVDVLREMHPGAEGSAYQRDAVTTAPSPSIISTDPPYFDNVPYADLSDFFYVWLRRVLPDVWPDLFRTIVVPKSDELVANPVRHGGRAAAESFFMTRMRDALCRCAEAQDPSYPSTIYYAFKQVEDDGDGASSTGWETFLEAVLRAGNVIDGTWPVRSERAGRMRELDSNALASSIVLVCRKRGSSAPSSTRGEFRRALRKELPEALRRLQHGNIAPVDVAQASIGPGMAIFSRHSEVLEADGSAMTVRSALQLINEVLDEYLASSEGDFDGYTRFAITWYEQHGWEAGPFGEAETLAKARNVSVNGVVQAGICKATGGKVRILKRAEMRPTNYDPNTDDRPTIWEFTQHLIRCLEDDGEEAAARLLKKLGSNADAARELAYRLYNTCERKKWTEDARSYNGLILAWPELEKLAAKLGDDASAAEPAGNPGKKGAKKKVAKGQRNLFAGDDE